MEIRLYRQLSHRRDREIGVDRCWPNPSLMRHNGISPGLGLEGVAVKDLDYGVRLSEERP